MGSKRLYKIDLPVFQIQTSVLNEFVKITTFTHYPRYTTATGITDHNLLTMSIANIVGFVPFNCVLKKIEIIGATTNDGVISIWKTGPDGTSNPVEIYYNDTLTNISNIINLTSSIINSGDSIQLFFTKKASTTGWFAKLFLTFEEL